MNWYNRQLKIAKRVWTEDELGKIRKLLEEGKSSYAIGKLFGVNSNAILYLNKKYKWIDFEKEKLKKDKLILGLYLLPPDGHGMPAKQITKEYGYEFSGRRIYKALERSNLTQYWRGQSEAAKKKYKDNPELGKQFGDFMRQKYKNDPDLRKQISDSMKKTIKDIGGLAGMLLNCSTRDKAISMLNYNVKRIGREDSQFAFNTYTKYIQIINNHTYPDEVQQGVTV